MEEIRCIGCGAIIQSSDEARPGYVPANVLKERSLEKLLCRRCHRIKYYNEFTKNELPKEEYFKIIDKITKEDALFVYVIDLFDFDFSLNKDLAKMLAGKDVILVCNKLDLLPKSQSEERIKAWVRRRGHYFGLNFKDIVLVSVKNKKNIDKLTAIMDKYYKGRNTYILGNTNVGKSSLINILLRSTEMVDYDLITASSIPATTLDLIEIPFFANASLYDSPGLILTENILSFIASSDYSLVMPKTEIKPHIYQLSPMQSIIISGFACFNYLEGPKNSIVLYFSNQLELRRCKNARAKELFPSCNSSLFKIKTQIKELDYYEFKLKKQADLVIAGLGFITIKKTPALISIAVPKGTGVLIRDALIG